MSQFTIFHNPRCSKSRQTLALLQANGIEPEIRLYLDHPPSPKELTLLLKQLGMNAPDLLRKGEAVYKELNLKNSPLSEDQLIKTMCEHPKLIERPIVIHSNKAVVGRPPENVLELIQ